METCSLYDDAPEVVFQAKFGVSEGLVPPFAGEDRMGAAAGDEVPVLKAQTDDQAPEVPEEFVPFTRQK